VLIRIEGRDLPGHRLPATAATAVWTLEVASREVDGLLDIVWSLR
jgi:hypothetical protein